MVNPVKTLSGYTTFANKRMKTIRTNRGWWLITPESEEQAAALEEFLNTFKCSPELPAVTKRPRDAETREVGAPVLRPR